MSCKEWMIEKAADFLYAFVKKKFSTEDSSEKEKIRMKNIRDVIQCEGNYVLSKASIQDFNTKSILQVQPGEEAVFIDNGKIIGVLSDGRHILDTLNYPFLSDVLALSTGGKRIYSSKIYFVRKSISWPIDWGTSVQVRDPVQLIATRVMCRGSYRIKIKNSVTFVENFAGNGIDKLDYQDFSYLLRDEILQTIKVNLVDYIMSASKEILGIVGKQEILAEKILKKIKNKFIQYGIEIITFSIEGLDILEHDINRIELEKGYRNKRLKEL